MREISLHILDIVQNSLAAGATKVKISLLELFQNNSLIVEIEDNGRGMDEKEVKKALDPFYTTRLTRRVGLGLPLLLANAQACGGGLRIESQPGKGTVVKAEFQLDHIDRPPVGDMVSTLLTLIAGSPQVDFFYYRQRNEKSFIFQTSEVKDILQGTSLKHPEILSWLRDYLTEKERELELDNSSI